MRAGIDCAVEVDVDFVVYRWVKVVGILRLSCILIDIQLSFNPRQLLGLKKLCNVLLTFFFVLPILSPGHPLRLRLPTARLLLALALLGSALRLAARIAAAEDHVFFEVGC